MLNHVKRTTIFVVLTAVLICSELANAQWTFVTPTGSSSYSTSSDITGTGDAGDPSTGFALDKEYRPTIFAAWFTEQSTGGTSTSASSWTGTLSPNPAWNSGGYHRLVLYAGGTNGGTFYSFGFAVN